MALAIAQPLAPRASRQWRSPHRTRALAAIEPRREARQGRRIVACGLPGRLGVPCETEPLEVIAQSLLDVRARTLAIHVLDAQEQTPASCPRRQPRAGKRTDVAEVQQSRGRW